MLGLLPLERVRALVAEARAQRSALITPELIELAAEVGQDARVVIDLSVAREPLVVVERGTRLPENLTARERDVASLVARGLANKQIARQLGISVGTVKIHVHRILEKTGLPSRAAIAGSTVR
jgi:DNA-binding NarL/FixJ family response regulator